MEINIKTLTPLWTGGVEAGKCDRIHETGILGSLRWWMEVLVRGMGGNTCDPTEQKCSRKNGLCDICKFFGVEGQKRRFRMEIEDKTSTIQFRDEYANNRFLSAREGEFKIKIQSLDSAFDPKIIGGLIQFIADWSALGARPQMGFGVIRIVDACIKEESIFQNGCIPTQPLYNWLTTTIKSKPDRTLPSLQNIFLAHLKVSRLQSTKQDIFKSLKNDFHQLFANDQQRHDFIMGTAQGKRMAAKIKISRSYDNHHNSEKLMRVWGWIPEKAVHIKNWNQQEVVQSIHNHLDGQEEYFTLHDWREMKPERDPVTFNEDKAKAFLRSLLGFQEDN